MHKTIELVHEATSGFLHCATKMLKLCFKSAQKLHKRCSKTLGGGGGGWETTPHVSKVLFTTEVKVISGQSCSKPD